jgi:hypothetical protein
MRIGILLVLAALALPLAHAQQALPAGPDGFAFAGEWDCKGQFINGKPHHSHDSAEPVLGGAWLHYDSERKQLQVKKDSKEYTVDIAPGTSHWVGYTTFHQGIVKNDELLVERDIVLSGSGFPKTEGKERQYILLNAAP